MTSHPYDAQRDGRRAAGDDPTQRNGTEPADSSGAHDRRRTSLDQDSVRRREREAFGGVKFGATFLGWLTAVGAVLLLASLVTAAVTGLGIDDQVSSQNLRDVGIGAAIVLLAILSVAYFLGGYVAGRMSRFSGLRQGVAVWLWGLLIAVALAVVGLIADEQTNITNRVSLPPIPIDSNDVTTAGLIGLAVVLGVTLLAAMAGGMAGMRFHRKVDRAGFDTSSPDA